MQKPPLEHFDQEGVVYFLFGERISERNIR